VYAGSHYCDGESGTQMEVRGHVMIILACLFINHGSVPGNSYFLQSVVTGSGVNPVACQGRFSQAWSTSPLFAKVKNEWS